MKMSTEMFNGKTKNIVEVGGTKGLKRGKNISIIIISQTKLRLQIETKKASKEWKKKLTPPMRKEANRSSTVRIRRGIRINEFIAWNAQSFGMSECNRMQTLVVERDGNIRAIRREESIEDVMGYVHDEDRRMTGQEENVEKEDDKKQREEDQERGKREA